MQKIVAAVALLAASGIGASGQANPGASLRGDVAVTYDWVHTNAQPGDCGCFGLSGGGISGSWIIRPRVALLADVSSETSHSAGQANSSLTLTSYTAGLRYYPTWANRRNLEPFGEALIGGAHAGGSGAGVADDTSAFAARIGGGIDVPMSKLFVLRIPQIDYLPTTFANTANEHQNNLVVSGGIVLRWSKSE